MFFGMPRYHTRTNLAYVKIFIVILHISKAFVLVVPPLEIRVPVSGCNHKVFPGYFTELGAIVYDRSTTDRKAVEYLYTYS
jgi:hypothetical protein